MPGPGPAKRRTFFCGFPKRIKIVNFCLVNPTLFWREVGLGSGMGLHTTGNKFIKIIMYTMGFTLSNLSNLNYLKNA